MSKVNIEKLINANRQNKFYMPKELTAEQIKFVKLAREGDNPVAFYKMAELWEELGWGKTSTTNMQRLYRRVINGANKKYLP